MVFLCVCIQSSHYTPAGIITIDVNGHTQTAPSLHRDQDIEYGMYIHTNTQWEMEVGERENVVHKPFCLYKNSSRFLFWDSTSTLDHSSPDYKKKKVLIFVSFTLCCCSTWCRINYCKPLLWFGLIHKNDRGIHLKVQVLIYPIYKHWQDKSQPHSQQNTWLTLKSLTDQPLEKS